MGLDYRNGVSILELVIYCPFLFATVFVCVRHGFMKSSGWIFLSIFCCLRIVGASAQLATINSTSKTPYTIAAVSDSIGLSPLLLASLGLISRAFYSILKNPWGMIFQITVLRIPQVVCTVALILCIVGATNASTPADFTTESTVHIGIILYLVAFVLILILTFAAAVTCHTSGKGEKNLIIAVACSLPFILVRLIYSTIGCFAKNASNFNIVTGSVTLDLCMAVLEEMAVVVIYTITGIRTSAVPKADLSDNPARNMMYRTGRGDFGTGKLGLLSLLIAGVREIVTLGEKGGLHKEPAFTREPPAPKYSERRQDGRYGPGAAGRTH